MSESKLSDVQGMVLTADGAGAVFDVPSGEVELYIQGAGNVAGVTLEVKQLPALTESERSRVTSGRPRFGSEAGDAIASVPDSVIPVFWQHAEELLSSSRMSAVDLLAKVLAKAAGYTDIKKRSLFSSMEKYTALHLAPSFMPENRVSNVALTADGRGAVFDDPWADVEDYLQAGVTVDEVKELPVLQDREQQSRGGSGGMRFGGGGGERGDFDRGGGGRFGWR